MALFKCKSCGAELEVNDNARTCKCKFCGAVQTLPSLVDERKQNIYNRANELRRNNEYDKASSLYEELLIESPNDSDLYWSLILCKFGVEYVDDALTNRRIPTINRVQYTSIYDDENYKLAIKNAKNDEREIYEEEAKLINEIQKKYLEISAYEDPYDVFICYKETDDRGRRTRDSVLASDLYSELTSQGYKVFFARVTLEDKLGQAYEPYIFQALNTAKVMVVVGTARSYFDAVWVKNEWSRFLNLIKKDNNKVLIPAYAGMNASDLPEEFKSFQAQDMTKLGFLQDLVRGINKLVSVSEDDNSATLEGILKRVDMLIEDEAYDKAKLVLDKALNIASDNPEVYERLLLADFKVKKLNDLVKVDYPLDDNFNYQRLLRFAEQDEVDHIKKINEMTKKNYKNKRELKTLRRRKRIFTVFITLIILGVVGYGTYTYVNNSISQPGYIAERIAKNEIKLGKLSEEYPKEIIYNVAKYYQGRGEFDSAITCYEEILTFDNATTRRDEIIMKLVDKAIINKDFEKAFDYLKDLKEPTNLNKEEVQNKIGVAKADFNLELKNYGEAFNLYNTYSKDDYLDKIKEAALKDNGAYIFILEDGKYELAKNIYDLSSESKENQEEILKIIKTFVVNFAKDEESINAKNLSDLINFLENFSDREIRLVKNELKRLYIEKYPAIGKVNDYKFDLEKETQADFSSVRIDFDGVVHDIAINNTKDINSGMYDGGYVDENGRKYLDLNKPIYLHTNRVALPSNVKADRIHYNVYLNNNQNEIWGNNNNRQIMYLWFEGYRKDDRRRYPSTRCIDVTTVDYAFEREDIKKGSLPSKGSFYVHVRSDMRNYDTNEELEEERLIFKIDFVYDRNK